MKRICALMFVVFSTALVFGCVTLQTARTPHIDETKFIPASSADIILSPNIIGKVYAKVSGTDKKILPQVCLGALRSMTDTKYDTIANFRFRIKKHVFRTSTKFPDEARFKTKYRVYCYAEVTKVVK